MGTGDEYTHGCRLYQLSALFVVDVIKLIYRNMQTSVFSLLIFIFYEGIILKVVI